MSKHPGLQYQNRMREAADRVARANCALLDAEANLRRRESEVEKARDAVRLEEKDLQRARVWLNRLVEATRINEDGLPLDGKGDWDQVPDVEVTR